MPCSTIADAAAAGGKPVGGARLVVVAPLAVCAAARVAQLDEVSSLLLLADSVIEGAKEHPGSPSSRASRS
jgi:hypothetical protein